MSKRRLRPDELDLWNRVARTTDPLHRRAILPAETREPEKTNGVQPFSKPLPSFEVGSKAKTQTAPLPSVAAQKTPPVKMDAKAFGKLKRGKLKPDARIDLHGMTLAQAHPALTRFVLTAQAKGHRLILVITGKGDQWDPHDPAPRRRGVLKLQVPQWLALPPLASEVLQVSQAHISHGGGGAYYVYLRKSRGG